jgi:hypothetical protein
VRRIGHEARPQRQPRIERAPSNIRARDDGPTNEAQYEAGERNERQTCPARRQQTETRPRRYRKRYDAGRAIGRVGTANKD